MALLDVSNLKVQFKTDAGSVKALSGVSFHIEPGESVGIVGESGSGKSVSMLSVMGLLPSNAKVTADELTFNGKRIAGLSKRELRHIRGGEIGMIFQDPMTSLNPLSTVGQQLTEPLRIHLKLGRKAARERAIELMRLVEIPAPESRLKQYPHQLSGGLRQRVMIAMAIACNPKLLIADEPTTALDVTIQAQILDILAELKEKLGMGIVLITHDMGVIAGLCSRVIVMYGGMICECGTVREIFYGTKHPYTNGLLRSIPDTDPIVKSRLEPIPGSPPDMLKPPPGCPFAPRCENTMKICRMYAPEPTQISDTHFSSCWLLNKPAEVA
ncbi:MAG: ABC transporter ATP-binding protein [Oscillospiraceae bacterium]|jgi:oligopeptide transport system ATP-binding protein|nr:ABC transporter ATP-binding protein [Oscillospiraceae bacterium]